LVAASLVAGCESAPAEPEPNANAPKPTETVPPLVWDAPPVWTKEKAAARGEYRARYTIPKAGSDKHDGELLISHLGRGAQANVDKKLAELLTLFEGYPPEQLKRETFKVGELEVHMMSVVGSYKFPMGPAMGKQKRHAAHVIKENWRGLAAGVITPKRGNWFFRSVGPHDTMTAAYSPFRAMLEGMR